MKQLSLIKKQSLEFGGSLLKGKRKSARPLDSKKPIHFVLKATCQFKLLMNKDLVERVLQKYAGKFGITLYVTAVQIDHVHICARISSRRLYHAWIRAVTSVLVQRLPGLRWKLRPYSRVSLWGKAFARLKHYILDNAYEGNLIFAQQIEARVWHGPPIPVSGDV